MGRGRRPAGSRIVEQLDGSAEAKQRLAVILETLAGQQTVAQASRLLGIGERHFHCLRLQTLQETLRGLEPRPLGRPGRRSHTERATERASVEAMQEELRQARIDLQAAQIREEIALAMPQLLRRQAAKKARRSKQSVRPGNDTKPST